mgnify:CR=1 FL=1
MYERDKDFKKPLSVRPNGHINKKCGWCKELFMTQGNNLLCSKCSIKKGGTKPLP